MRGEDPDEKEQAAARLTELEATVTELRAELDARDRELAERERVGSSRPVAVRAG